jgi:hypothetical protein
MAMLAAFAFFAVTAAQAQDTPKADAPPPPSTDAATAKPAVKMMKKVHKGPASVKIVVTNARAVGLAELTAAPDGGEAKTILKGLAPGKKKVVSVAHGKSCVFDLHAVYDDSSTTDNAAVDLCKDKTINLVE